MVMTSDMYHILFEKPKPEEYKVIKSEEQKKGRNKK